MADSIESRRPQWMVVRTTYNPGEANIIAGRLQSEGIGAWVHQEPFGSAMGITVGPLGEVKVVVDSIDYDRALAILDEDVSIDLLPDDVDQTVFDEDDVDDE